MGRQDRIFLLNGRGYHLNALPKSLNGYEIFAKRPRKAFLNSLSETLRGYLYFVIGRGRCFNGLLKSLNGYEIFVNG